LIKRPVILITDDIKSNRFVLKTILSKVDADLIEAASGNETLVAALNTDRLALILLDVQMPEMDGYEVAELLKQEPSTKDTPIIFITAAFRDEEHALKGYAAGAVDYIQKPINKQILLSKVEIFLQSWRLKAALEHEIEKHIETQKQIERLARYDQLTDLPNRHHLWSEMEKAIARTQRSEVGFALLFLDLDGFKAVNDNYGHEAGDAVLQSVAGRLNTLARKTDLVARYGGDEFVILFADQKQKDVLGEKLQGLIDSVSEPVEWHNNSFSIGVSVGVVYYEASSEDSAETLIKKADEAMYQSKQAGGNVFRYYAETMNHETCGSD